MLNSKNQAAPKQPKIYSPEPPSIDLRLVLEQEGVSFEPSRDSNLRVKNGGSSRFTQEFAKAS